MSLESGSKKSRSIDGGWIRENETKEYKLDNENSQFDKKSAYYQLILKRLKEYKASFPMQYERMIDSHVEELQKRGFNVTREQIIEDIKEDEIRKKESFERFLEFARNSRTNETSQELEEMFIDDDKNINSEGKKY